MQPAWLLLKKARQLQRPEVADRGQDTDLGLRPRATSSLSPHRAHIMLPGHLEQELLQWLHGFLVHGGEWCIWYLASEIGAQVVDHLLGNVEQWVSDGICAYHLRTSRGLLSDPVLL